jgi:hypothetical protein
VLSLYNIVQNIYCRVTVTDICKKQAKKVSFTVSSVGNTKSDKGILLQENYAA